MKTETIFEELILPDPLATGSLAENNVEKKIERVDIKDITARDFRNHFQNNSLPVVILNGLNTAGQWSIELMKEKLNKGTFPVRCYGPEHFNTSKSQWKKYCDFQDMSINDYTEQLQNQFAKKNHHYMAQVPIGKTPLAEVLRHSMQQLSFHTGMQQATDMGLWLGPNGHTEPLHWDCAEGTVLMLHGAKKVVLFPPEQRKNLYPFPLFKSPAAPWFSQVYVEAPDYNDFPKLKEAMKHQLVVNLQQGEILYIPALWWHELSSVGNSTYTCSVNRFWKVRHPIKRLGHNRLALALYLTQMAVMSTINMKKQLFKR